MLSLFWVGGYGIMSKEFFCSLWVMGERTLFILMEDKKMKKKLFAVFAIVVICFAFSACNQGGGKTSNVEIEIGDSEKFTKEEIEEAIDCAKKKFVDFEGCELLQLWYDETKSDSFAEGYMTGGRGSDNGVSTENVIVLLSNFKVDSSGGDGSFNPDSTYTNWNWILIRDNKTAKWKVDDWGY